MEKGTVTLHLLDTGTTIYISQLFSYIKKKYEDQKDMIMISCRDLQGLETLTNYHGPLEISGRTLNNKKHPQGLLFTCHTCVIVRAEKRLGYCEYLFVCQETLIEE